MKIKDAFLSLVGRRQKDQPQEEIKSVVILFNKINHVSLIAATLCERIYQERVGIAVTLVDIRDIFPENADRYLWLDCGSPLDFIAYFMPGGKYPVGKEAELKTWFDNLSKKSLVFTSPTGSEYELEETLLGKLFFHLYEERVARADDQVLFSRYAMLSESWLDERMENDEAAAYTTALHWAYQNYNGAPISLNTLLTLLTPSESEVQTFLEKQKLLNRALSTRYRTVQVGNRMVYQLTAMGPEVYGLLRRVRMVKKPFMHVSMGGFGMVMYSSIPLPEAASAKGSLGGILDLTPSVEPVDKATAWKVSVVA